MGQLKYPQERKCDGPWLLDREDLEELHKIILVIDNLLKKSWELEVHSKVHSYNQDAPEEELALMVQKEKEKRTYKHEVSCNLISTDGASLTDNHLLNLLKDNALKNLKPKELHIKVNHGMYSENKFDFRISDLYSGDLRYEVECFDSNIKNDVQYEVDRWIDKRTPKKVIQYWTEYGVYGIFPLLVPILLLAIYAFSTSYSSYNTELISQSHQLIENGIDSSNVNEAIELMMKYNLGYVPKDYAYIEQPRNPIYLRLSWVSIFLVLTLLVRPKTTIGIGKMTTTLTFYRYWIRLITVILPAVLILGPFWQFIIDLIYH